MDDEDLKKLPKWARAEIEKLRADAEFWKEKALAASSSEPGATDVVLETGLREMRGLPSGSTVRFRIGPEEWAHVSPAGRNEPAGVVRVYWPNNIVSRRPCVFPVSSNVVYLGSAPR